MQALQGQEGQALSQAWLLGIQAVFTRTGRET